MSFVSQGDTTSTKPALGGLGGRPTKLTPNVLNLLSELLDSGISESPTHLLQLLSVRGIPMSRPTLFKAIDKLGRSGSVKWRMSSPEDHVLTGLNAMEDVRRYTDTTSIIKVDEADDSGVLDLRTPHVLNPHGRTLSLEKRLLPSGTNDNVQPVSQHLFFIS